MDRKICFVSFANTSFYPSLNKLKSDVKKSNVINDFCFFTEKDLGKDDMRIISPWLYRRGYGYWRWKAILVNRVICDLECNDILIYADAGCSYNIKAESRLESYIKMADDNPTGIVTFCTEHVERKFTKGDVFDFFKIKDNKEFTESFQIMATMFIVRVNETTRKIIQRWAELAINHDELFTDVASKIPNLPDFIEHRHDQSVFSLLMKQYSVVKLDYSETQKNNFSMIPIVPNHNKVKTISTSLIRKMLIPYRLLIGVYLKYYRNFYFQGRIAW